MEANDDIERQIREVSIQMNKLARSMYISVSKNKELKRKASSVLKSDMKTTAPRGKTGNLQKSIQYLPFKGNDVFIGPKFKIAPHGHLIEYGFVHYKDGKLKDKGKGVGWMRRAYDRNKSTVLQNLISLAKIEFEKVGRQLEVPA